MKTFLADRHVYVAEPGTMGCTAYTPDGTDWTECTAKAQDAEGAWAALLDDMQRIIGGNQIVIFRVKPEVEPSKDGSYFTGYARLASYPGIMSAECPDYILPASKRPNERSSPMRG